MTQRINRYPSGNIIPNAVSNSGYGGVVDGFVNNSEGAVGEPRWNFCIPEACDDNGYFQPDIFNIAPLSPHLSGSQVSNGYTGGTLSPTHPPRSHAPSETYVTGQHDSNSDVPCPSNPDASLLYQQPIDSTVPYGQGSSLFVPEPTTSTIHQTTPLLDSTHGWTARTNSNLTIPSSSDPPTSDVHRDISSPYFQPTSKLGTWASRPHQELTAFRSSTSMQTLVVAGPSQSVLKLNHHVKKTGASEKKQYLACLFCRERKIACGGPVEGSADSTCNQCARRQFKCEYPKESRRGQHKRSRRKPHDVNDSY